MKTKKDKNTNNEDYNNYTIDPDYNYTIDYTKPDYHLTLTLILSEIQKLNSIAERILKKLREVG